MKVNYTKHISMLENAIKMMLANIYSLDWVEIFFASNEDESTSNSALNNIANRRRESSAFNACLILNRSAKHRAQHRNCVETHLLF